MAVRSTVPTKPETLVAMIDRLVEPPDTIDSVVALGTKVKSPAAVTVTVSKVSFTAGPEAAAP